MTKNLGIETGHVTVFSEKAFIIHFINADFNF